MQSVLKREPVWGVVHYMAYPQVVTNDETILTTLSEIVADGCFQAVELGPVFSDKLRIQAREVLEASGIEVYYGAQPVLLGRRLDLGAVDKTHRDQAIETIEACIREARMLGARALALVSGPDPGERERMAATERLVDSLRRIGEYAASEGNLPLMLEFLDRQPFGKNGLIGPSAEAAEVCRQVRETYPHFGLLASLGHMVLLGEAPREMAHTLAPYLVHAHIGMPHYGPHQDSSADLTVRLQSEAYQLQVTEFMEGLVEAGFFKPTGMAVLSLALKLHRGESSRELLAAGWQMLRQAWACVNSNLPPDTESIEQE